MRADSWMIDVDIFKEVFFCDLSINEWEYKCWRVKEISLAKVEQIGLILNNGPTFNKIITHSDSCSLKGMSRIILSHFY